MPSNMTGDCRFGYARHLGSAIAAVSIALLGCDGPKLATATYDDCVIEFAKAGQPSMLDAVKRSCKQKYPKTFDFEKLAAASKTIGWLEVTAQAQYRNLGSEDRDKVKRAYFEEVLMRAVHPDFVEEARYQFMDIARDIDRTIPLPLPKSGEIAAETEAKRRAPLTVSARDSSLHYYVKLEDWETGKALVEVFIRAGEAASIKVPIGVFRLKFASGSQWFGAYQLFGDATSYGEARDRLEFAEKSGAVAGYEIKLWPQSAGNMNIQSIEKNSW